MAYKPRASKQVLRQLTSLGDHELGVVRENIRHVLSYPKEGFPSQAESAKVGAWRYVCQTEVLRGGFRRGYAIEYRFPEKESDPRCGPPGHVVLDTLLPTQMFVA